MNRWVSGCNDRRAGEEGSMTAQDKCIIETILADVGLEHLHVGANDQEPKTKPVTVVETSR